MNRGKLYLIPVYLTKEKKRDTMPESISLRIKNIDLFIVENIREARRNIKKIFPEKDLNKTTFFLNGKHNIFDFKKNFLDNINKGRDLGLMSDAGTPCVADPGSKIVSYAHLNNVRVIPLVGPSSILLAIMGSGMNGQKFTFNGYLPIDNNERKKSIKKIEHIARTEHTTQIFIETPFRNKQLIESIIENCKNDTQLCVATHLTGDNESIISKKIFEWKKIKIDIHKSPSIFLISYNN